MPSFSYPPSAGGGGGGGGAGLPVTGGSGSQYASIAIAQANEVEDAATTFAPQAGTVPGVVVGPGALSAVDGAYNDYWLVNESPAPSNGLVCRYARVSQYVGATRTLTIDQPWNFAAETLLRLVSPIRLSLNQDIAEDVTFVKNVELDLGGHRLQGMIDQTVGSLLYIRGGSGYITNGVQKTNLGVVEAEECSISRRDDTIYALLMTGGSNLGRTILRDCSFSGVVAGRRGRGGWEVDGCRNYGIPEGTPTDRNIPYRFFESVAGVAVVVDQADVEVAGEWAGAVFYSENSITGATAFISVRMDVDAPKPISAVDTNATGTPLYSFLYCSVGAATMTMTWAAASIVTCVFTQNLPNTFIGLGGCALFINFTGTFTVAGGSRIAQFTSQSGNLAHISVIGATTMSGTITLSAMSPQYTVPDGTFTRVLLQSTISSSITDSTTLSVFEPWQFVMIGMSGSTQNNAGASVTVSGQTTIVNGNFYSTYSTGVVSAGSWVVSGAILANGMASPTIIASLGASVSGGTFTISGVIAYAMAATAMSSGASVTIMQIAAHGGTGGTLTISSATVRIAGHYVGTIFLARASGAGATVVVSAALIDIRNVKRLSSSTVALVDSVTATSSASLTGVVRFENCEFISAVNILNATVVGAVASGPSSIVFESCFFADVLTDATGAGTITWAAASLRFEDCQVNGLFTFVGTRFSSIEGFETYFNANSANESVTATGVRPTTYRYWGCHFRALYRDLLPEVLYDWTVVPASVAVTAGELQTINASGQSVDPVGTSAVEGVVLEAAAALGNPVILVRRGEVFVDSESAGGGAVVAGSNTGLDGGTPTQQMTQGGTAAQRIGRALEATGTTRAGEAYTIVNLM